MMPDRETPAIALAHWSGLEPFDAGDLAAFASLGRLLDQRPIEAWSDERAEALLAETDVLVGHWGCPPIDEAVLERAPNLGLIAYAAGTVRDVVTDAVFARDIRVTSAADANGEPVAEFTLAVVLLANKDMFWHRDAMRDRSIRAFRPPSDVPIGNWDKTVGIVGASTIGRRVIELLRPFPRLAVVVYDPYLDADEAATIGVEKVGLDALCGRSDVLSIHAPDLAETRHMIGAAELGALRTGATVVNTARGALLDHEALVTELEAGRLYAVLDVTDPEPLPGDHPLRTLPNVFLTPHLAGSQGTELRRLAAYAADEVERWKADSPARNEVTRERLSHMA